MKPTRLDELRSILLGPDHEKLDALRSRVEEPERRSEDVAEVLPDSIAASFRRGTRLVAALRTPLRQCVAESVREDPEEYANALFPVMGPAIRRAVAEAFKGWIQQANQAMEQSLSVRGLGWRVQAWRAGVPFGQYVLQQTLLYRVEHVYLIQSASGLLIEHVHQADALAKDEDAVSAMFTAIQDFVRDSFQRGDDSKLRTAELGELTLWAVHGPSSVIVAVIRGLPPTSLRTELAAVLEEIEADYSDELRRYRGERGALAQLRAQLARCLLVSLREPTAARRRRVPPALVLLVAVAGLLVVWLAYQIWIERRLGRLAAELDASPGVVVTALTRDGGRATLRGLRDPLAAPVDELAERAGWRGPIAAELRPYLSLEPELVLARARASLAPPAGVQLDLDGSILRISGQASADWIRAVRAAAPPPGVTAIDTSGLSAPDLLGRLRRALEPPASAELSLERSRLTVSGEAASAWAAELSGALAAFPELEGLDTRGLTITERRRMAELAARAAAATVRFEPDATPEGRPAGDLDAMAAAFREFATLARELGEAPAMTVIGNSDPSGSDTFNVRLELRRAERVKSELVARGIAAGRIATLSQLEARLAGPRERQVRIRFEARPQTSPAAGD